MEITAKNFNEIVNGGKPVVIDFWAPWCGPCRRVAPIIEELAADYQDRVVVGKVNVDEEDDLASQFRIMSIPTVVFIKNGQVVDKIVGLTQKAEYQSKIDVML